MGRPLLSATTQDVIQLQQSPLSLPRFDDTRRICNDDERFLHALLTFFLLHTSIIGPRHSSHSGSETRLRLYKQGRPGESCVCKHRAAVWTARKSGADLRLRINSVRGVCLFCLVYSWLSLTRKHEPGGHGRSHQVQLFRQEHPGFAGAGCGGRAAVVRALLLLQLPVHGLDGVRQEPLYM